MMVRRYVGFGAVLVVAVLMFAVPLPTNDVVAFGHRTGGLGNEPIGGFSEGDERVEIFHDDGTHNTTFAMNEVMHVTVRSASVANAADRNRLRIFDHQGNKLYEDQSAFTKIGVFSGLSMFNATVDLSTAGLPQEDYYLLDIDIREQGGGNDRIEFREVFKIIGAQTPEKYIRFFRTADYQNETWIFNRSSTVFIEVWAGTSGAAYMGIDYGNSELTIADYYGNNAKFGLDSLTNTGDFSMVGDYFRLSFDLVSDLGGNLQLQEGYWYTISLNLVDSIGGDVVLDWAGQIYINIAPTIQSVGCIPGKVDVHGANTVDIYTVFSDADAQFVNEFTITIGLRYPDDIRTIFIAQGIDATYANLSIQFLGDGVFNATFTWDPAENQTVGLYDIYVQVKDGYNAGQVSGYDANPNILELYNSNINSPVILDTYATPPVIKLGDSTTITGIWSDADGGAVENYRVSFKLRDPNSVIIPLVNSQTNGGGGELGGNVSIALNGNEYVAEYHFTPPLTWATGGYDIEFSVEDSMGGYTLSPFENNTGALIIANPQNDPVIEKGATYVDPSTVVVGNETTIACPFMDYDDHAPETFIITFKLRHPSGDIIILVNAKNNGSSGEMGGYVRVVRNDTAKYMAYYTFTVPMTWDPAKYDLYAMVEDVTGRTAEDKFGDNQDELNVLDWRNPPSIVGTTAIPSSIDRAGNATTTIYGEFKDPDNHPPEDFNITIKIRHESGTEITLVDGKHHGESGFGGGTLSVVVSGSGYLATYVFDPDASVPVGLYDLYFKVVDPTGLDAVDPYALNTDELEVWSSNEPPVVSDVKAIPSSVDKIGANPTTIYAEFTDSDTPNGSVDAFNITLKLRDPEGNDIVLIDKGSNGDTGLGGGTLSVTYSGTVYTASYQWDPPNTAVVGKYDLYCRVYDNADNYGESGYDANKDELEITSSAEPPIIENGATTCIPSSVAKAGSSKTQIFCEFTDADTPGVDNFTVTFKVRGPNGTLYTLVNSSHNGESGESGGTLMITYSGTVYIASYYWDPPKSVPIGKYDLYTEVRDSTNLSAVDGFENNIDELEIIAGGTPPKLTNASVVDMGDGSYQFTVVYTDMDGDMPEGGVVVVVGNQSIVMSPADPNDNDTTDGKVYTATAHLEPGNYSFHFQASDGIYNATGDNTTSGDINVPPSPGGGGGGPVKEKGGMEWVIAAVVLLLIVITLVLYLYMRKRAKGELPPQEGGGTSHVKAGEEKEGGGWEEDKGEEGGEGKAEEWTPLEDEEGEEGVEVNGGEGSGGEGKNGLGPKEEP